MNIPIPIIHNSSPVKKIMLLLLAVAMSGCGLRTKYQRPENIVPDDLYRHADTHHADSLGSFSWKSLFTDANLQSLIRQGLDNNTDLKIAHLKVTEAEASLSAARLAFLPSVLLTGESSSGNSDNSGDSGAVSVHWEFDLSGKLSNAEHGAKAQVQAREAHSMAVQTRLIATIADAYYTLLMLDKQRVVSTRAAKVWAENIRAMQALKEAGQATEAGVAQAEASRLGVESAILTLEKQIRAVENSLSVLLGWAPRSIPRGSLDEQVFPSRLATGVPLQLLHNRPDVRQAEYNLVQAFYMTEAARAAFYPSVSLSGSSGWTRLTGDALSAPGPWLLNAIGSVVQPLFNRGVNRANLKITEMQQKEAMFAFQQSLLHAGAEVNDALTQWQTARRQMAVGGKQVRSLEMTVIATQLMMEHSGANYLEVLTAQQALLSAELAMTGHQFNEIQGVINLYYALGGGSR